MTDPPESRFSHVGVGVTDLDRSTRFWTELFGFTEAFTMAFGPELEATMEVPGGRFTSRMLTRGDLRVELLHWDDPTVAPGDGAPQPMTRPGMTHLCFRVDDVDEMLAAAEAAGGAAWPHTLSVLEGAGVDGAPVKLVYATDPDGTRVEFMSGAPELPRG